MYRRHDLLVLKNTAEKIKEIVSLDKIQVLSEEGLDIPAIVKRQDNFVDDKIEVGFSFPFKVDGVRFRVATDLDEVEIKGVISPYEVLELYQSSNLNFDILNSIIKMAEEFQLKVGIFGSGALEIITGYKYLDSNSDFDILVRADNLISLRNFSERISELEKSSGKLIDIEVEIQDGFSIKMKEFFGATSTIIAKGLYSIELIKKDQIKFLI